MIAYQTLTIRCGSSERKHNSALIFGSVQKYCCLAPDRKLSKVAMDERACVCEGATPRFEMGIPQMPSMDHVRPDLKGYRHLGSPCYGCQARGVIEQRLSRSHLDQHWRE